MFTTCSNFKSKKNIKEWTFTLVVDDCLVPDAWKTNPWALIGDGFDINRMMRKDGDADEGQGSQEEGSQEAEG